VFIHHEQLEYQLTPELYFLRNTMSVRRSRYFAAAGIRLASDPNYCNPVTSKLSNFSEHLCRYATVTGRSIPTSMSVRNVTAN